MSDFGEPRPPASIGHPELESRLALLADFGFSSQFPTRLQYLHEGLTYMRHYDKPVEEVAITLPEEEEPGYASVSYNSTAQQIEVVAHKNGMARLHIGTSEQVTIIDGIRSISNIDTLAIVSLGSMKRFFANYPGSPEVSIKPVATGWEQDEETLAVTHYRQTGVFAMPLGTLTKPEFIDAGYTSKGQEGYEFTAGFGERSKSPMAAIGLRHRGHRHERDLNFLVTGVEVFDTTPNVEAIIGSMATWLDKSVEV